MFIFCHANGFSPDCYQLFFKEALNYGINFTPFTLTPLDEPFTMYHMARNWHDYGWDLINKIDHQENKSKITGVGHSMGGVLLLKAAIERPELFNKLVLLDPTILPRRFIYLSNYLPKFITRKVHPVASKAYRRKDTFDSYESAFDNLRGKKLFKYFSDEALWNYVNSGFKKTKEGSITLTFTKQWEEHCFLSVISTWGMLKKVNVPTTIFYGEKSDLIHKNIIERIKKINPKINLVSSRGGHLFPMEFPGNIDFSQF